MGDFDYDSICRHVGHMYLSSQFQIQKKEKEALDIMLQNQELRNEIKNLHARLAEPKGQDDEPRPQGTSG